MADHLNKQLLFSCILSCILISAVAISEIDYDELTSGDQVFNIIDIRTRQEVRDFGQIPTSHVLPLLEIEASLYMSDEDFFFNYGFPKLDPNDESLVFTCRSGGRVRAANEILKKYGFNMHRLYLGSFLDWTAHGGPLVRPGHPFQPELMDQPEVIV